MFLKEFRRRTVIGQKLETKEWFMWTLGKGPHEISKFLKRTRKNMGRQGDVLDAHRFIEDWLSRLIRQNAEKG